MKRDLENSGRKEKEKIQEIKKKMIKMYYNHLKSLS